MGPNINSQLWHDIIFPFCTHLRLGDDDACNLLSCVGVSCPSMKFSALPLTLAENQGQEKSSYCAVVFPEALSLDNVDQPGFMRYCTHIAQRGCPVHGSRLGRFICLRQPATIYASFHYFPYSLSASKCHIYLPFLLS